MPELQRIWQAYRHQGVAFVGVVLKDDDKNAAQAFLREAGIVYPNGQDDDGRLVADFHVVGLPNTFILSKEGRLVHRFIGPVTAARLSQRLEQALAL
jgi:cytochrome c biogenesis protein CcmG/thiol:disulfide interchange protein DsbE